MAAIADVRSATLALLDVRARGATVCPSEVARALVAAAGAEPAATDWRDAMPAVHAAIDALLVEGVVSLSWKGQPLETRAGPYRIARGACGE